jgi:hypothetical protein
LCKRGTPPLQPPSPHYHTMQEEALGMWLTLHSHSNFPLFNVSPSGTPGVSPLSPSSIYLMLCSNDFRLIGSGRAVHRKCPWQNWQALFNSWCVDYLSGLSVPNTTVC